jgi:hypothetical protein
MDLREDKDDKEDDSPYYLMAQSQTPRPVQAIY